jgi:type I site-specific restriction endonuclease
MTPEETAREQIDAMLTASGWIIQNYKALNLGAGVGIAVREVPLTTGPCDYLLLVNRQPVGVIEAKRKEEGKNLSVVADQSGRYASSLPDFLAKLAPGRLPFLYESTGVETFFRDERDPAPRSRRVFSFHRPETLAGWFAEADTLRKRLAEMPAAHLLPKTGMRDCQIEGITELEESFAAGQPRSLIQMATGAGKTFAACAFTYRLIVDTVTADVVIGQGFDAAAKEKASALLKSFRDYIETNKAEITALQILYSRPFKQRLTEAMLKDLEAKLKETYGPHPVDRLWHAFEIVHRKSHIGNPARRFADLVALVRFALEQQPVLAPFAGSVSERFNEWLMDKAKAGVEFNGEQLAWLNLIRDHIATAISIEPEDLELSPFSQRGGLGKAHQLFGEKLPELLDELNTVLAA